MTVKTLKTDGTPMRVLVVDDDELSREVIALLLANEGHEVETADSGDAALLRLTENDGRLPEVVLTDLQMPGIAGVELAQRLRERCGKRTMLLAMSGSKPETKDGREFDGFLLKPFSMGDLAHAIAGGSAGSAGETTGEDLTASDDSVLEEGIYRKLAGSMAADRLEQLYALCVRDAETRIESMRQAAAEADDAAYRREAHAIKGGCGMVGAREMQTLATSMEEAGLSDANHIATLDEFMLACGRLRRILVARRNVETK